MRKLYLACLIVCALIAVACLQDFNQFLPNDGSGGTSSSTAASTSEVTATTTTSTGTETAVSSTVGTGGMGGAGGATVSSSSDASSSVSSSVSSSISSSAMSSSSTGGGCNPVTEKDCNGSCVLINDPDYGCTTSTCTPCSFPHVDVPVCMSNMCAVNGGCATGYADCDTQDPNGCEAHLTDDPQHCGMCMHACGAGEVCANSNCVPTCGGQPVPATGDAVCWVLSSTTLAAGKYGTITVSRNAPALSGPSDPITPGCVSAQPATNPDTTDPSVLCPVAGVMTGDVVYLALKEYGSNMANPPLPFFATGCDQQDLGPTAKCVGSMRYYHNGALVATFTDPPAGIFSYHDTNQPEPLQLKVQR